MPLYPVLRIFGHCPQCKSRGGKNSSLSFLYSEFPEGTLRLCSNSGSNLRGGNRSPFWGGFLAVLASPVLEGLTSSRGGDKVNGSVGSWALLLGKPHLYSASSQCLSLLGQLGLLGMAGCAAGMACEVCVCGQCRHCHRASYWALGVLCELSLC